MSIFIKGMEIPKNCDDCHFDIDCPYDESQDGYKMLGERPRKCPLVPVPPHGRLIDADALCKTLHSLAEIEYTPEVFANWIENHIDTIVPADDDYLEMGYML